ncbi:SDR family oxidoreductase [Fulvimarina sp. MAC3]|uniref:SDR family NAD(P)-dependent oxidoreductase n=1 Tax=Fulvimarina sp. MAC3 TaxID=3148887 RepID=UPI0031FDE91C
MNDGQAGKPVALITGASSGLGLALARRWAGRYRLVLTGRREEFLEALPEDALYVSADLAKAEEAAALLMAALDDAGLERLDLAVLNAGTGLYGDPFAEDAESLRETLAVNLTAPVLLAHSLFPRLKRSGGRLVLVGSVAHRGSGNLATYAASKGGLDAFARALREEWRGRVGVSMIHPGPIATAMHEKAGFDPKGLRRIFASPDRMAAMVERAAARERTVLGLGRVFAHKLRHGGRF